MTDTASASPQSAKKIRLLLIIISICFALWTAALIAMYITTVYLPQHGELAAPSSSAVF